LPGNTAYTCETLTGTANAAVFEVTFTFPELIITLLEPGEVMTMVRQAASGKFPASITWVNSGQNFLTH
jgi:hypothetical protein